MPARQRLRRGQGDNESCTGHEGLRGSRALDEMWGGSAEGLRGGGTSQNCRSGGGDLREREELSEGLRNSWTRAGRVGELASGGEGFGGCTEDLRGSEDQIRQLQEWS